MKNKDALKLEPKQKVIHRRYGVCFVKEVIVSRGALFGVVVTPANQNGQDLLKSDCRCDVPDVLEDQTRNLSIDHVTAWGSPEPKQSEQEKKDYFDVREQK